MRDNEVSDALRDSEPLPETKPFVIPLVVSGKKRSRWRRFVSMESFLILFLVALVFLITHSLINTQPPRNYSWWEGNELHDIATVVEEAHGIDDYDFSRWLIIDNTVELKACLTARGYERTIDWMFPAVIPYFKVESKATDRVWYYHGDELLCARGFNDTELITF